MELLIFITIPVFKAWHDHKNGNINHIVSGLVVLGTIVALSIAMALLFKHPGYVYIICGLAIQWAIFDDLYNLWHGNKFGYIGKSEHHQDDIFYKLYERVPWFGIIFAKCWMLLVAYSFYFKLDWIL